MKTCLQSAARGIARPGPARPGPARPALQLIATTAASWNLIAPVRARKRVRRIALRGTAPAQAHSCNASAPGGA